MHLNINCHLSLYTTLAGSSGTYMSSRRVLWCDWRAAGWLARCRLTAAKGDGAPLREYARQASNI